MVPHSLRSVITITLFSLDSDREWRRRSRRSQSRVPGMTEPCRSLRARGVRARRAWCARSIFIAIVVAGAQLGSRVQAQAPAPAPGSQPPAQPAWTFTVRDMFRGESWRFFEPQPGGGDPDYTFAGNQLFMEAALTKRRFNVTVALQHVGLVNLPDNAVGPGPLGTGALYYAQGNSHQNQQNLYLRFANVQLRQLVPGLDIRVGRQGYTSGAEGVTSNAGIEAIKRQRLDARLVGEFEWSQYQRAFDGVRADWRTSDWLVTGVAFLPTQGGFAREAGATMTDVGVAGVTAVLLPTSSRPHFELQGFVWRYDDRRDVIGRPDNTGLSATKVDITMTTGGGTLIGARPVGSGRVDMLGWVAVQRGDWYGQQHSAISLAGEAGYQWTQAPGVPWLRGGWFYASGDGDPNDDTHGTFFPMLPTVRRFAQTTVYSTMNLEDGFVQFQLRPARALTVRADVHSLRLASASDRWYTGSGATLNTGATFGYSSRPSNGATRFGTAVELSAAHVVSSRWTVSGFAGTIDGGAVVTGTFAGDRLWFAYVESVLRLAFPWR